MRYALMRSMDISNGVGIGVSLFVQGCRRHCENCFNQETWDFSGGKEWDKEAKDKFLELASKPYITRISILGGEPLEPENVHHVKALIEKIRKEFSDKVIWLYTGFTWKQIWHPVVLDVLDQEKDDTIDARVDVVSMCDVVVDGSYVDKLNDISLPWCGSSNQNIIDVKKTMEKGEIVLYNN